MLRFSLKNPAAESFVAQFVHASVPAGSDEHERHRRFLTASGAGSGLGLGIVPLLVAGHQASPGIWAGAAAIAAVPFFLALFVSRSGRLDAALNAAMLAAAMVLGVICAAGSFATPLILIAALACLEPTLWRIRRPVAKGIAMALIAAATASIWLSAGVPPTNVTATAGVPVWITAAAWLATIIARISRDRWQADTASRRDREQLDILSAHTGDLVTAHKRDGSATYVSPASNALTGATPSELVGTGFAGKIHLQDRIVFLKAVSDVWHSRAEQTLRLRLRQKGDSERSWVWIEMTVRARLSQTGAVICVVASSRNITDQVERESSFEEERHHRERVDAAQKRFLATMSHELRTPLNAIIGFADVLEQELFGQLEQERHREYVSHIHSSGQHLLNVVNDMLDMSRIDAGRYELDYTEFSLGEVVGATLGMLQQLAQKSGVTVHCETNDKLPAMRGDRRSWQQILINLVSNAIKFTPEGGTVHVKTRQLGRHVRISVRDTGIGIDPAFLASIGEPFMQAESGTDRRFEGSGLGLSVVKGLVGLHGGDFDISSAPGKGTTATVILPMQPSAARPVPHVEDIRIVDLTKSKADDTAATSNASVASKGAHHARLSA